MAAHHPSCNHLNLVAKISLLSVSLNEYTGYLYSSWPYETQMVLHQHLNLSALLKIKNSFYTSQPKVTCYLARADSWQEGARRERKAAEKFPVGHLLRLWRESCFHASRIWKSQTWALKDSTPNLITWSYRERKGECFVQGYPASQRGAKTCHMYQTSRLVSARSYYNTIKC